MHLRCVSPLWAQDLQAFMPLRVYSKASTLSMERVQMEQKFICMNDCLLHSASFGMALRQIIQKSAMLRANSIRSLETRVSLSLVMFASLQMMHRPPNQHLRPKSRFHPWLPSTHTFYSPTERQMLVTCTCQAVVLVSLNTYIQRSTLFSGTMDILTHTCQMPHSLKCLALI